MGTAASSASSSSSPAQKTRLDYLGDRYPFGDAELTRLARCHAAVCRRRERREGRQRRFRQGSSSFLSDWAVVSSVAAASQSANREEEGHEQRRRHQRRAAAARMEVVEGRILPSGFGHRLERAAFLLPSDVVVAADPTTGSSSSATGTMEDGTGEEDHGDIQDAAAAAAAAAAGTAPGEDDPYRGSGGTTTTAAKGGDEAGRGTLQDGRPAACPPCGSSGQHHGDAHLSPPMDADYDCYGQVADGPDPLAGTAEHVPSDASFQRLDKFVEGASECCRRGARPALTVLFQSCRRNNLPATNNHHDHEHDPNDNDPANLQVVNVHEVLDLGYRLALAAAFLSEAAPTPSADRHDEVEANANANAYLPADGGTTALSQSLLAYAQNRRRRQDGYPPHHRLAGSMSTSTSTGSTSTHVHGTEHDHDHVVVTLDAFWEWAEQTAPCLAATLSTFLHQVWFPDQPYPPSRTPFLYPRLGGQESAFFDDHHHSSPRNRNSPLLFALACMSPSLGGSWHRLYTSDSDGLSFNRLFACLLGYGGPTVLLVREAEGGGVFGAFTATAWKERKDFYGNSDCFLFRASSPSVGVYRPRGRGTNYMYCNSVARSRGYDGLAHGIGFGGTEDLPRLFIAETFEGCVASSADLTFEPGPLLPPAKDGGTRKYFSICDLEVWGVGGDEAVASGLDARKAQRAILDATIQKARKVDKAQFLDDFKSGLIESKAFKHRTEARGRHDFEADDNDGKDGGTGYKIPPDKRGSTVVPGRTIPGTGL